MPLCHQSSEHENNPVSEPTPSLEAVVNKAILMITRRVSTDSHNFRNQPTPACSVTAEHSDPPHYSEAFFHIDEKTELLQHENKPTHPETGFFQSTHKQELRFMLLILIKTYAQCSKQKKEVCSTVKYKSENPFCIECTDDSPG